MALTLAVCLLHPAYYLWRLGVVTPQEFNRGFGLHLPDWERIWRCSSIPTSAWPGGQPFIPLFAVIGAGALGSRRIPAARRSDLRWAALAATILGGWFLLTFAETTNVNSGGTMSMSRYAMWLLPLAVPFLAAAAEAGFAANLAMLGAGIVAFPLAAVVFDPALPERYVSPTPQAAWLNDWLPGDTCKPPKSSTSGSARPTAASAARPRRPAAKRCSFRKQTSSNLAD